jgi:hypothetical protein
MLHNFFLFCYRFFISRRFLPSFVSLWSSAVSIQSETKRNSNYYRLEAKHRGLFRLFALALEICCFASKRTIETNRSVSLLGEKNFASVSLAIATTENERTPPPLHTHKCSGGQSYSYKVTPLRN